MPAPAWATPGGAVESAPAEWDGVSDLGEDQAVALALAHSPMIRAELERVSAARADLVQAGLLPNPMVNVSALWPIGDPDAATAWSASAMEQLSWLWLREPRTRAASHRLRAAVLGVSDTALGLVFEVRATHAGVVSAQRAATAALDGARSASELARLARARLDAGESTEPELNRFLIEEAEAQARRVRLAAEFEGGKRRLLGLLGRSGADAAWDAVGGPASRWSDLDGLAEEEVIGLALRRRLDAAEARALARASGYMLDEARLMRLGEASAGPMFERTEDRMEMAGVGLAVMVPILDTGAARVARGRADSRRMALEANELAERAVREARVGWHEARARAEAAERYGSEIVRRREQNLRIAEQSLEAGEADLTEVLMARLALSQARVELAQMEAEAAEAFFGLERAVGGRLARREPPAR